MKKTPFIVLIICLLVVLSSNSKIPTTESNPMPDWNNTSIKEKIMSFVEDVSDPTSENYVPVSDRIAVFDNDGTLWTERPLYIPLAYEISYLEETVPKDPELQKVELYNELSKGNLDVMHDYSTFELISLLFASHGGQNEDDYEKSAYDFLTAVSHPRFNQPYKKCTYAPMVELVRYLQENDFKVFIVTGGEISFTRTVSEEIYNIPQENVVGTNVLFKYKDENGSEVSIVRTEKLVSANDKQIKPANIELHIGKKPIFAAGNSDGDYEMMEYTLSGSGPSMAILVFHDDEEREYSYTKGTEKALLEAKEKGWDVISMKSEFKEVFQY